MGILNLEIPHAVVAINTDEIKQIKFFRRSGSIQFTLSDRLFLFRGCNHQQFTELLSAWELAANKSVVRGFRFNTDPEETD